MRFFLFFFFFLQSHILSETIAFYFVKAIFVSFDFFFLVFILSRGFFSCLWWWWCWCNKIALFSSSCGLLLDFLPNKFTRKTIKWNVIEISCFSANSFWLRIFFFFFLIFHRINQKWIRFFTCLRLRKRKLFS